MNLIEMLDDAASKWASKPALIEGPSSISYAELAAQVSKRSEQPHPPGDRLLDYKIVHRQSEAPPSER